MKKIISSIIILLVACLCPVVIRQATVIYTPTIESHSKDSLFHKTVAAADNYINNITTKSELDINMVLYNCLDRDIDFIFVLAQAQLESHFGTAGVAAKTNSVWNVNSWDGHSAEYIINNGRGYDHPNQSIIPYMDLLQNKYLVDGRTEMDMMDNFVNIYGQRYASDKNYEQRLKRIYKKISDSEVGKLYYSLN